MPVYNSRIIRKNKEIGASTQVCVFRAQLPSDLDCEQMCPHYVSKVK